MLVGKEAEYTGMGKALDWESQVLRRASQVLRPGPALPLPKLAACVDFSSLSILIVKQKCCVFF